MKKHNIFWRDNGWTVIREADSKKHLTEISCLCKDSSIIEIRKRHNDGEEEVLKKAIDSKHSLPMSSAEFEEKYFNDEFEI